MLDLDGDHVDHVTRRIMEQGQETIFVNQNPNVRTASFSSRTMFSKSSRPSQVKSSEVSQVTSSQALPLTPAVTWRCAGRRRVSDCKLGWRSEGGHKLTRIVSAEEKRTPKRRCACRDQRTEQKKRSKKACMAASARVVP